MLCAETNRRAVGGATVRDIYSKILQQEHREKGEFPGQNGRLDRHVNTASDHTTC